MNNRIKESSTKKRIGITLFDVLLTIIIIAVGVLVYEFVLTDSTLDDTYSVVYVIKVAEVRDELTDRVAVGDEVFTTDGTFMGNVKAYEVTASRSALTGQIIPGRYDLYVTITAESSSPDEAIVSGYEVLVEREYSLRTDNFSFSGVCISVGK